jgi:hemoglobin/transferrin/lactoferrin receptor protein
MLERFELIYGQGSVVYGSDAIGGTVNAISYRPKDFEPGFHLGGRVYSRVATAERSIMGRLEVEGNVGRDVGFLGGISVKSFGDMISGDGDLPYTGYDQFDANFSIDWFVSDSLEWILAYQHSTQEDVPRTHKTIHAVPYEGTAIGSELQRNLDQTRDLVYSRWIWTEETAISDRIVATLSFQRQTEERNRVRSGDRRDISGFDVNTLGVSVQAEKDTSIGLWTYGADWYHDEVDSYRKNYRDGSLDSVDIQGPLGDDATYDLVGLFAQDEFHLAGVDWIAGLRFSYAAADAERVDNPEVPGSDPSTPGNVISISDSWGDVVGSVRGSVPVARDDLRAFFGVSQAFRAPTLYDLTSFESTSVFEVPTEGLDPETFLTFELGLKTDLEHVRGRIGGYYTLTNNVIVRSPTGEMMEDTPVVAKENSGSGYVAGIEFDGQWLPHPDWTAYAVLAWQDGEVDQYDFTIDEWVQGPISRLVPFQGNAGVRWEPAGQSFWVDGFTRFAAEADRLSLRDESDTERIPPGGTPGWITLNVRSGWHVNEQVTLALALENILDEDYRVHGAGLNEPGRNLVASVDFRF